MVITKSEQAFQVTLRGLLSNLEKLINLKIQGQ